MTLLTLLNVLKIGTIVKITTDDKTFTIELRKRSETRNGINAKSIINTGDYTKIRKEGVNIHSIVKQYIAKEGICEIYL